MKHRPRKLVLVVVAIVALGASLGAASLISNATGASSKTIVIGATDLPAAMDMQLFSDPHQWDIVSQAYEPFIRYLQTPPKNGLVQESFAGYKPGIARSWKLGPNNTSLTINVRPGVRSAFGNEFTANDIKWTIDRAFATKAIGYFFVNSMRLASPASAKVISKYTIRLTPKGPAPLLLALWATPFIGPFDSAEAKKHATPSDPWATKWMRTHDVGFGPYTIDKWITGDRLELKANPNYWRGKPAIDRIIYKKVPTSSSRVQLLKAGALDIAEDLSPPELDSLRSASGVKVVNLQRFNYYLMVRLNHKVKPLNNPAVGQALNYATPREQIVKTVYLGRYAQPLNSFLVRADVGYTSKYYRYKYDLAKARQLLSKAGYPNGFTTSISFNSGQPGLNEIARILKDSWSKIGVKVNIESVSPGAFTTKLIQRKYAMPLARDQALLGDPVYVATINFASGPAGVQNYADYKNPQVDKLINKAAGVAGIGQRSAIGNQIQRITVFDHPAWVYIVEPGLQWGVRSSITKFSTNYLNSFFVNEFTLR